METMEATIEWNSIFGVLTRKTTHLGFYTPWKFMLKNEGEISTFPDN